MSDLAIAVSGGALINRESARAWSAPSSASLDAALFRQPTSWITQVSFEVERREAVTSAADAFDSPKMVPRLARERNRVLPIIVAGSLSLHASLLLLFLPRDHAAQVPHEISVELVQMPPADPPDRAAEKHATQPPGPKPSAHEPPARQKPPAAQKPLDQKPAHKVEKPAGAEPRKPAMPERRPRGSAVSTMERMKTLLGDASTSITGSEPTDPLPALGGVALPGVSAAGTLEVPYAQLVMSRVAKAKKQGRYKGVPGRARVAFTLSDAGTPENVVIATPSGDPSLDEEAIAMIKRGAPYPTPPPGAKRDFIVGLQFRPEPE